VATDTRRKEGRITPDLLRSDPDSIELIESGTSGALLLATQRHQSGDFYAIIHSDFRCKGLVTDVPTYSGSNCITGITIVLDTKGYWRIKIQCL
jgi:hypothetical protein